MRAARNVIHVGGFEGGFISAGEWRAVPADGAGEYNNNETNQTAARQALCNETSRKSLAAQASSATRRTVLINNHKKMQTDI